ncbi:UNVERIFIED_CONTAM: hypothetical protein GTU68_063679 [Idotea baltica]|nr:hypothetical protein [Idotea baltica]
MAFSLQITKLDKSEIDSRVKSAAEALQLTEYLGRLPKALSGGQRQRVAIGRAIVRNPKVFLFDEPLSNLDAALRVKTRLELATLHEGMPDTTMLYVTHDQVEAMTLADRIVVLSAGYIEQVGSPLELYERPNNLFVAQFIGSPAMNILPAVITDIGEHTQIELSDKQAITMPVTVEPAHAGKSAHFGVRPEDLELCDDDESLLRGDIAFVESLGEVTMLYVNVAGSDEPIVVKVSGILNHKRGDTVSLKAPLEKLHLFDEEGQTLRN